MEATKRMIKGEDLENRKRKWNLHNKIFKEKAEPKNTTERLTFPWFYGREKAIATEDSNKKNKKVSEIYRKEKQ